MVEVLGMLDLTLDRVRYASGSSGPDQGARRPAVPGRRRLAAIVRFHTLYFISPLSVPLAHVLQLLRAPARMGGFALYTQGTCPGTPGGTRVALNERIFDMGTSPCTTFSTR